MQLSSFVFSLPQPARVRLIAVLVCLASLILGACQTSLEPRVDEASVETPVATAEYCGAVETMLIAQPAGAPADEELQMSMDFYADSVERLAELSRSEDALVLFELAATARLVGVSPGDLEQAQRLSNLVTPVAAVTVRASQACGIAG